MTTTMNQSIPASARTKAQILAQRSNQDVVVYAAEVANKKRVMSIPLSDWEKASVNSNVAFLAVINAQGNYVD